VENLITEIPLKIYAQLSGQSMVDAAGVFYGLGLSTSALLGHFRPSSLQDLLRKTEIEAKDGADSLRTLLDNDVQVLLSLPQAFLRQTLQDEATKSNPDMATLLTGGQPPLLTEAQQKAWLDKALEGLDKPKDAPLKLQLLEAAQTLLPAAYAAQASQLEALREQQAKAERVTQGEAPAVVYGSVATAQAAGFGDADRLAGFLDDAAKKLAEIPTQTDDPKKQEQQRLTSLHSFCTPCTMRVILQIPR
jgi:hypothetical protein